MEVCDGFVTFMGMKKQSAAIPFRRNAAKELEILLVTSRRKGRWVLPKGTVRGVLPHATAAREAFEEAGALGVISRDAIGVYYQRKRTGSGDIKEVPVQAFPLFVNTLLGKWPEMAMRKRQWMHASLAAEAVNDDEIRTVLEKFVDEHWDVDPS
ncbi:MAG: NUDIX hydrolase [Sphingobium sp.]